MRRFLICDQHFTPDQYTENPGKRLSKRLFHTAVPNINLQLSKPNSSHDDNDASRDHAYASQHHSDGSQDHSSFIRQSIGALSKEASRIFLNSCRNWLLGKLMVHLCILYDIVFFILYKLENKHLMKE